MHSNYNLPVWKTAPFVRLLLPLIAGIILQLYLQTSLTVIVFLFILFIFAIILFRCLALAVRFKWQSIQGIFIYLLLVVFGLFITWQKDVRHHKNWFGHYYHDSAYLIVRINEPVSKKNKSCKAEGRVESILSNNHLIPCTGKLLLYFQSNDSSRFSLNYGDKILINKPLQSIKNSGNPGAFDYERYASFQQVFHNVFLRQKDWMLLKEKNINLFRQFIFATREKIIESLQNILNGGKDELGIAEALLIGYTNDLDKDLVQAYSNTGVVHIIAISGMHLGLIYVMLVWLFKRAPLIKKSGFLQLILILSCLWIFSLLTGASASVLRSAVMFTFITAGRTFEKQSNIYNSLASSAFVLLCYDPFFLWDVGFQLSYLAVVSIIVFQKPVYNLLYVKNKWFDKIWQLAAVSLAAQILTFPICIFYFHQFPNFFLFTNLIAVPLSSVILFAEIFLVVFGWIPFVGLYSGKATALMITIMNNVIIWTNNLPYSVWDNIPSTVLSTLLLYIMVISTGIWLINKNRSSFTMMLISLFSFLLVHSYYLWQFSQQEKIIVYNVAQHRAIDFVQGRTYQFVGDSVLLQNGVLQNFHLKPARIALQLIKRENVLSSIFNKAGFYQFQNKRILLIDTLFNPAFSSSHKIDVDVIVISKNAKVSIPRLSNVFNCHQYVFDASNSLWKIEKWKKDCEQLLLRCHSVPEQGAFILSL